VSVTVEMYWTEASGRDCPFTSIVKSAASRSVIGWLSPSVTLTSTSTSSARAPNCAAGCGAS
jgi:hypothetical protein